MYPDINIQPRVLVYSCLDGWYGFIPHWSVVVCQHLHLIIKPSRTVHFDAKPFSETDDEFLTLSVIFWTSTFTDGDGRLVELWHTLPLRMSCYLQYCTCRAFCGSWSTRTGLFSVGADGIVLASVSVGASWLMPASFRVGTSRNVPVTLSPGELVPFLASYIKSHPILLCSFYNSVPFIHEAWGGIIVLISGDWGCIEIGILWPVGCTNSAMVWSWLALSWSFMVQ